MSYCIDASVTVKWFKGDEEFSKEAGALFKQICDLEIHVAMSEWTPLEVIRAMVKSKFPQDAIQDARHTLDELLTLGAVKKITVSEAKALAEEIEIKLNLYAADSIQLASAIVSASSVLLTEDKHLLSPSVKEFARGRNVEIKRLSEIAPPKK